MYHLLPIVILLLLGTTVHGQAPLLAARDSARLAKDVNFTAIVYSPLSVASGRPHLSAGLIVSKRSWVYAVDLEYGPNFLFRERHSDGVNSYELYGLRAELRRRVGQANFDRPTYLTHYLGLQASYRTAYRDLENRMYESRSGETLQFDSARREERRTELVPVYTLQFTIASRLIIEAYTGVGVSYREVSYHRQVELRPAVYGLEVVLLPLIVLWKDSAQEGSYFRPAIRGGLKLGVRL